jgi:hypothetical protein
MLVYSALNVPSVVPMSFIPHCSLFSWNKDLKLNSGLPKITSMTFDHVIKIFVKAIRSIIRPNESRGVLFQKFGVSILLSGTVVSGVTCSGSC